MSQAIEDAAFLRAIEELMTRRAYERAEPQELLHLDGEEYQLIGHVLVTEDKKVVVKNKGVTVPGN